MCATSAILDYGRRTIFTQPPWENPYTPTRFLMPMIPFNLEIFGAIPKPEVTKEQLEDFLELYRQAKIYDAKFDEPECEDPEKAKILDSIQERLKELQEEVEKLRGV